MIEYKEATLRDVLEVAGRLRAADAIELELATGLPAKSAVYQSFAWSDRTWAVIIGGRAECIFGITEISSEMASPWMVGTDAILRHQRELLVSGRSVVEDMNSAYPILVNQVYEGNGPAIRWLLRLGFTFCQPTPINGSRFLPFYRTNHV